MDSLFQISLHLKTPSGFETFGTFDLGNNREQALDIFSQLNGTPEIAQNSILYMDFSEIRDGIPFPVEILHCTLDELALNTRVITREVFKNRGI